MTFWFGYGLAGFLLLAAGSWPAQAQVKSLEDVPLPVPPKVSPWQDATDPQAEATESAPPDKANAAAATIEDTDIANLDIDWSLLDVDASTLMTANPKQLHAGPRAAPSNEMLVRPGQGLWVRGLCEAAGVAISGYAGGR
jgi:hypothetical protein